MSKTLKMNISFDVKAVLDDATLKQIEAERASFQEAHDKLALHIERGDVPVLRTLLGIRDVPDVTALKIARGRLRFAGVFLADGLEGFMKQALRLTLKEELKGICDSDKTLTFSPPKFTDLTPTYTNDKE